MTREENDAIMAELAEMVGEQLFDQVTLDAAHLAFRNGNLVVAKSLLEGPFYQPFLRQSHREGMGALLSDISTAEALVESRNQTWAIRWLAFCDYQIFNVVAATNVAATGAGLWV